MRLVVFLLFSTLIFSQEKDESIKRGKLLYQDLCLRCHMPDGKGVEGIYPPLAKSDFLFKHLKESILAVKQGGIEGEIIVNGVKILEPLATKSRFSFILFISGCLLEKPFDLSTPNISCRSPRLVPPRS